MRIMILSRQAAEELLDRGFPDNTAVISFHDPPSPHTPKGYTPMDYRGRCARLFRVGVYDIDIESLAGLGLTFETYFPEADELARFIISAAEDGLDLICQCEYGQSRSPACAAAILEFYCKSGIKVFADYRYYPNQLIFNKLLNALKRA